MGVEGYSPCGEWIATPALSDKRNTHMSENASEMASSGQIDELGEMARKAVPKQISKALAQEVIERPHSFITHVGAYFSAPPVTTLNPADLLERRIERYRRAGLTIDFPSIKIPKPPASFAWPIPVLKGMTPNRVFEFCEAEFPAWRYTDDLDTAIVKNDRDPYAKSYVIWVRNRIEADEELKNLSADMLAKQKIKSVALHERLLLEWFYYDETQGHLDIEKVTCCSGSRSSDGSVPSVCWDPAVGELGVGWCDPRDARPRIRARAVAS